MGGQQWLGTAHTKLHDRVKGLPIEFFPTPVTPTFETLTPSTQNFTIPDPISLQAGKGQAEGIFQGAQQRSLRPNGMHTRIIPAWTPGLYQ